MQESTIVLFCAYIINKTVIKNSRYSHSIERQLHSHMIQKINALFEHISCAGSSSYETSTALWLSNPKDAIDAYPQRPELGPELRALKRLA